MARDQDRSLLIDVTRLVWRCWTGHRATGIDRVCIAYLEHFGPRAQAVVQYPGFRRILSRATSDALFALLLQPGSNFRRRLIGLVIRHGLSIVQPRPGRNRWLLNVGHTGLNRQGVGQWIADIDARPIYMVHDLIPVTHPQFCKPMEKARHERRIATMLKSGCGLIANSSDTARAVQSFAREQGLTVPPLVVAHLGTRRPAQPRGRADGETASFVVLGTIEARKNHALLLDIWDALAAEHGPDVPRLLVIGQRGWECDDVLARLDAGSSSAVAELGACDDAEVNRHLDNARALLFPSHAEGFGMPLTEALAAGVPVIASDLAVFKELADDVPDYAAPDDLAAWKALILDYASPNSPRRAAQLSRLGDFKPSSWSDHFASVETWLSSLEADGVGAGNSRAMIESINVATADSLASPPETRQRSSSTR